MPLYDRKDRFYQKAKQEGHASRAIYKIQEIDQKFKLLQKNSKILELGSAPGGWMEYLCQKTQGAGKVFGIDLLPLKIKVPSNAKFIQGDAKLAKNLEEGISFLGGSCDAVVSDLSPNLSGVKFKDAYLSYELASWVLSIAKQYLKSSGFVVFKIFPGKEFEDLKKEMKTHFSELKIFTPEATRKSSIEVYVIARKK